MQYLKLSYPSGCILAKVNLTDCVEIDQNMKKILKEKDEIVYRGAINSKETEYGFKLENIEKIDPMSIKGKLGLWNYEEK